MPDNQTTTAATADITGIKKRMFDGLRLKTGPVSQAALNRLKALDMAREAMVWEYRVDMKSQPGWFKWLRGRMGEPGVRWSVEVTGNSAFVKFKHEKDWLMFEWMFNHRLPLATELSNGPNG